MSPIQHNEFLTDLQENLEKILENVKRQVSELKLDATSNRGSTAITEVLLTGASGAHEWEPCDPVSSIKPSLPGACDSRPLSPDSRIRSPVRSGGQFDGICPVSHTETDKNDAPVSSLPVSVVSRSNLARIRTSMATVTVRDDVLFTYSWEDHTKQLSLAERIQDMRDAIDIYPKQWPDHTRVTDACGREFAPTKANLDSLQEDQFDVTVKWIWLTRDQLRKPSIFERIKFYYHGLRDNTYFRAILLRMKSRLKLLQEQAQCMVSEMMEDEGEKDVIQRCGSKHYRYLSKDAMDIYIAKDTLRGLEVLITHPFLHSRGGRQDCMGLRMDQLLQMAGCPFNDFVEIYLRDRDRALKETEYSRRELVKLVVRTLDMLEIMCSYLQSRIDANDQLLFKLFLMVVNILSLVAELVWVDYVKPELWDAAESI